MHSKREQWAGYVQGWQASGLSQAAWCREQGLSLASFGYWRRRLAEGAVALAGVSPLCVQPVAAPDSAATVQLHLAGGMRVSLAQVDRAWLAGLLRALGAC
ncbi:IS66 family insertion sequence element accessory protein TnpA [Xanthomonas oryzae]|uniref:IS66 family insertion sequence element accessory protein TnpB n=1 Tax=Xanthomonas oryzae pv. leersiae TaxID=3112258 RepID=A0AAJ6GUX7_9XANT|nr:IS66 family insertion sequence element accessory protein TnpB [Xanthomonas oryzae]WIX08407.1 IS66 family insertion sequence element accessory protein TnpB [Xanthomonas oryzae pv. oryzae]